MAVTGDGVDTNSGVGGSVSGGFNDTGLVEDDDAPSHTQGAVQ